MRIVSRRQLVTLVLVASAVACVACGARKQADPAAGTPKPAASKEVTDAGSAAADTGPPPRPFAGSPQEATSLIGAAIDLRATEIQKCVAEYRARKKMPHERVTISMGIDQEGRLLGATLPKGKTDPVLSECILAAMTNAPFPRSHSGVISITKSYEDIIQ